jgi:beta-ribofuranosylaminobenzene 5'-phosphate synthase
MEEQTVKVQVKTPARLHLGLIDINGDLGRMFGGLGVGIDHPNFIVEAENAEKFLVTGKETVLATILAKRFLSNYQIQPKVHIHVSEAIPSHIGLGSGTQFSIAIAVALAKLFNVKASVPELAVSMGRARRTAVGTSIFEAGGFVVDGGKNLKTQAFPPLIYRQPFPTEWRFIVAVPNLKEGLSNSEENHAFEKLTKMPAKDVGQICRLIMLKLLPALAERDIENFGDAVTRIQVLTGNHFAQAQGGTYASPAGAECIQFMKKAGAYGVGQSSWGPALYGVIKQEEAKQVLKKVKDCLRKGVNGEAFIAKPNNRGATIKVFNEAKQ